MVIPSIVSWILIVLGKNAIYLIISRLMIGISGGFFHTTPIFVSEISEVRFVKLSKERQLSIKMTVGKGVLQHIPDLAQILQGSELIWDTLNSKFLARNFDWRESYSDFSGSTPKFLKKSPTFEKMEIFWYLDAYQ